MLGRVVFCVHLSLLIFCNHIILLLIFSFLCAFVTLNFLQSYHIVVNSQLFLPVLSCLLWNINPVSAFQMEFCDCFFDWLIDDCLYSTILWSLEQTNCACMWFYTSDWLFMVRFLNIHQSGVLSTGMAGAARNCCRLGTSSVYTIQPCSMSLHAKPQT